MRRAYATDFPRPSLNQPTTARSDGVLPSTALLPRIASKFNRDAPPSAGDPFTFRGSSWPSTWVYLPSAVP